MDEKYFHDIHEYLSGNMAPDQKSAFENALRASPELQRDLDFERKLLAGMETLGGRRLEKKVAETHEKLRSEGFFDEKEQSENHSAPIVQLKKLTIMKRIISIAAAAVALFGIFWFVTKKPAAMDGKELFAKNFKPDTERATAIAKALESHGLAGATSPQDTLRDAIKLYLDGQYDKSIALLDSFIVDYPANDTARFYLAYNHLSRERYARAIELLQPISLDANSVFRQDATWNLALCFTQSEGQKEEACKRFEALSADLSYPKHREARAMTSMLCGK